MASGKTAARALAAQDEKADEQGHASQTKTACLPLPKQRRRENGKPRPPLSNVDGRRSERNKHGAW